MMRGSAGDGYESFTVFTSGAISGPGPAPPARTEYILSATDFVQLSAGPWFDDMCRLVTADGWWWRGGRCWYRTRARSRTGPVYSDRGINFISGSLCGVVRAETVPLISRITLAYCRLCILDSGVASKRKYFNFLAWRDFDTICLDYLHSPTLVSSSGRGSHEIKLIPLQSREAGRGRGEGRHCKRGRKTITKFVIFSFHKFINCVPTFESLMKCYNLGRRGG